jgi:sugar lactone lactonase YvrE
VLALTLLVAVVASASALAADPPDQSASLHPSQSDVAQAIESGESEGLPELTDPAAAEDLPLEGLQREEAVDLLNSVFGESVEAAAGIYDELQEATFLSPHVAVLPESDLAGDETAGEEEPGAGSEAGEPQPNVTGRNEVTENLPEAESRRATGPPPEAPAEPAHASLIDSTIPLQVGEDDETLDLSLERQDGILESVAPLVRTRIPGELDQEIEFPDSGISIEVAGLATDRSASISGGTVAFYPNVAADTDLVISPTPTGVETLTQLRSADSPDVSIYRFSLPSGASLMATRAGGAEVRSGEDLLLSVPAPTAIDAAGEAVPVEFEVNGDTLQVHVEPDGTATLPILVDPLFQTYEWHVKNSNTGICSSSFGQTPSGDCGHQEEWGLSKIEKAWGGLWHLEASSGANSVQPGIHVRARDQQEAGNYAKAFYAVPRYFKETPAPTSYIKSLKLSDVDWEAFSPSSSPHLFMGIWNSSASSWLTYYTHTGQSGHGVHDRTHVYEFLNPPPGNPAPDIYAKAAQISINATEATASSSAHVWVGAATVELGDQGVPSGPIPVPQTQWVNQTAPPFAFTVSDTGLGVYAIEAVTEELGQDGNPLHTWKALHGCVGVGNSACPRMWKSSEPGHQALTYDPGLLPSGINYLGLIAEDPVGNRSSTSLAEVKVDHIAPTLALTGSITEQEQIGTRRGTYMLKANGADGNAEHPQAGMAKAEVRLDGKTVPMEGKQAEEWSPQCASQNCALTAEWTLNTAGLAEGKHTVEVIGSDSVGNSVSKTLTIETYSATPPTLALSGSMTEQATLGTSRPRYILKAKSVATAAGFEAPTLGAAPAYTSSIGGFGTGNGQFYAPADVATDSKGNLWALDKSSSRLQKFNEKGEWLLTAGVGKLTSPTALALDASSNVWVADTGSNRIVEFKENGEFLRTFGTNVNKTKVEAGGTLAEKNLCTAASGNACQAATSGSLAGQLKSPQGIAVTPTSTIWVVDTGNSRLQKFDMSGTYISSLSSEGTEPGKLKEPKAMTVSPDGSLWVADYGNNRIQRWSGSTFVGAFGKEGSGAGEFKGPAAIEADSTGNIWVGDQKNNRVEKFDRTGVYLGQFGSTGTGDGQFSFTASTGLTVDRLGSIWITDGHFKVQRWVIPGFPVYSSSIGGTSGTGNSQFSNVADVAADAKGNLWALDKGNNRLQKFNEKGEWVLSAGAAGTGAGKLSSPSALALDSSGNVWVADTANNRIVAFNEKGEFLKTFGTNVNKTKVDAAGTEAEKNLCTAASGDVCQAATAGSLAGQLKSPQGIALTVGGNIWVADTGNSRIQKFGPTGSMINNLSGLGTEPGKLKEPSGLAVAPNGSIWVADTGNNRIQQWNSSLSLVRVVGKEGTGGGEFRSPASIEADSSGNIWVGDQKNNRVEHFGEGGKYLGQFGAEGSGIFSFSAPMGIAVDSGGSIWVTEAGNFKVQKWVQETPRSEIATTIWLDNNQQAGLRGICKTASCTIEPQWTVESKSLAAENHTAKVRTTDGLGRSTEKTISFQITPDTIKATLVAGGELVNAPEGWVEQETYGFNATATDGGSGVTSITFKIDGQQVASASQACPDGGCNQTMSKQISMASYAGGAHPTEIVTTDGAGNTFKKQWTINVDPEGHISTKEAEATLEAVEDTSEGSPIAPNEELLEPEQIGYGDNPELQQAGSQITSTGTPDLVTMTNNPAAGFTITSPYGETTIVPKVSEGASSTSIVEGVAGVSANASSQVDSVIRPEYNGVQIFQAIRSEASPEAYSWSVQLYPGQVLELVDSHHAQVMYESGKRAFLIAAEEAHDATGKEVPTSLEVNGNVLTLKVEFHKSSFVYPILAGAGWETSYRVPVLIEGPEDELEIQEREQAESEQPSEAPAPPPPASGYFSEAEALRVIARSAVEEEIIPAPASVALGNGASASGIPEKVVKPYRVCARITCDYWHVELKNPSYHYYRNQNGHDTAYWQSGTEVHSNWWSNSIYWPELEVGGWGCGFTGPGQVWSGQQKHLTIWGRYLIVATAFLPSGDTFDKANHLGLQIWVWPNGKQQRVTTDWDETKEAYEASLGCQ